MSRGPPSWIFFFESLRFFSFLRKRKEENAEKNMLNHRSFLFELCFKAFAAESLAAQMASERGDALATLPLGRDKLIPS